MFPPATGSSTMVNVVPNGTVAGLPDLPWTPSGPGTTSGLPGPSTETDIQSSMNFQIPQSSIDDFGNMSMDTILAGGFWDNVLVPGYSSGLEGLSGGFVFGAGGSGFITPRRQSPEPETLILGGVASSSGFPQAFQPQQNGTINLSPKNPS
ncbi:uncharacterized protein EI90DRAFT_3034502 [Cantharellus anzutake]|uniref:uncharacterized protein n=1 Tax=Cantharellus anzutake TaxID=1750568 RepID=UPI001903AAD5|nr:uncharacterized protein EI90DRAFT_3034502 [Cantharellus anzutake]KAF8341575.1 hypothetical protein EI90DRAFT_3034502 [Cantharellus anzutake]